MPQRDRECQEAVGNLVKKVGVLKGRWSEITSGVLLPDQSLIIHNFKRTKYNRHQTDSAGTPDEFPPQQSSRLVLEVQDSV